jgi:hypothetical protein
MRISLPEIKQAFDSLIKEQKSREELANWAQKLQFAEDEGILEYEPPSEKAKIWDGIEYLMGVDLKDADGSYLHSKESFIQYKKEKKF